MTDRYGLADPERSEFAELVRSWSGVVVLTLGGVLCCVGVIAISTSHLAAVLLNAIGAPVVFLGVGLLWWSARE